MYRWWVIVLLIAAVLRYVALDQLPPGLHFDEGGEGVAALDVTQGNLRIWWPIGGGKEPLMAYLVQPLFGLLGATRLALRAYAATMGVITVAATMWLASEWAVASAGNTRRWSGAPIALPLLAGLGLATAFWHVAYSRIGFRALAMPAVEAVAIAWLWHALRLAEIKGEQRARPHFLAAGGFVGLGAYTYLAGRFVPLGIGLFLAVEAGLAALNGRQPLVWRHRRSWVLMGLTACLVFLPLALFFLRHPEAFAERAAAVSIFNPLWNQGDLLGTFLHTTGVTLGTFAGLTGDPNPLGNLPGQPMLSVPLAACFWLGVALCLWRLARSIRRPIAECELEGASGAVQLDLFLLCWWGVMLLPAILAPEGAPHHLRLIGSAPATYVLMALGCAHLLRAVKNQIMSPIARHWEKGGLSRHGSVLLRALADSRPVAGVVIPLMLFLPVGGITAQQYFVQWAQLPQLYMAFDVYAEELAQEIAADGEPGAVYVIPMDLRAGHEARHYSLDFLYHGRTPYHYIVVDESTIASQMTQAASGARMFRVVRWTQDKHLAADEREVVAYLLGTTARWVDQRVRPVYQVETWALPSEQTVFRLPVPDTPRHAIFGGQLALEAFHLEPGADWVGVALRWMPQAQMSVDYKASVRLRKEDGTLVFQKDRTLRHNWHQDTRLWPSEPVNEYYWLAPVPPGVYTVHLVVYEPDTLTPLPVNGSGELTLGSVRVSRD
ncbi:MAG: hypothetical protein DDG58_04470 [Ardenticatenia bacterium]|nr:MAG: hypothetical protein DDG58_04470 [Ardenticatenia bacterium]